MKNISRRMILMLLIITIVFPAVYVHADTGLSKSSIDAALNKYNFKNGQYWSYKGTNGKNPGSQSSTDFVGTSHKANTSSSDNKGRPGESGYYGYHYYDANSGRWGECAGFVLYFGYKLTGYDPIYSTKWTKYKTFDEAGPLQPGDIVAMDYKGGSTHMAMVYTANNGNYTFIQASGSSNNAFRINSPFNVVATDASGKRLCDCGSTTIAQLKYIYNGYYGGIKAVVLRFNGITYSHISNLDAYYTIKGITPLAENSPGNLSTTDNLPYAIDWDVYGKNRGSLEPFYYSPDQNANLIDKHTVQLFHAIELVKNSNGEEWLKFDDGTFILKSKMEEQYKAADLPNGPGLYTVSEPNQTQWGYAPFSANHNGFDLKNGTEVYVARAVKNNKGNLWYEIDSVGSNKWVYSGHLTFKEAVITITFKHQEGTTTTNLPVTSGTGIPTGNLTKGNKFGLRGVITASEKITSVVATITDLNKGGNALPKIEYSLDKTALDIQSSKINNDFTFGKLPDGAYEYKVIITTASGTTKTVIDSMFTVGNGTFPSDDSGSHGDIVTPISADVPETPDTTFLLGDANGDGMVDLDDIMLMIDYYCGMTSDVVAANCDLDGDNVICDLPDIMMTIDLYCNSTAILTVTV